MARALPKRKRNPRTEVTFKAGGLTREILMMEPRAQYAVLSAVRGPDASGDFNQLRVKNLITERLRSIVFSEHIDFPGNWDDRPLDKAGFDLAVKYIDLIRLGGKPIGSEHFLDHLRLALKETWGNKVWGKYGLDLHRAVAKAAGF